MTWEQLETESQLNEIIGSVSEKHTLIYKHSTRCGVSSSALRRLEEEYHEIPGVSLRLFFLDLLKHRDLSRKIEHDFGVLHESPQILLINKGRCIYTASHYAISFTEVKKKILEQSATADSNA